MKTTVYTSSGTKARDIEISESIFGLPWNADLVHQVVVGMQANARMGTADARDRSDVRGGGKKPWKQKGTGNARHGSRRSPIWKGGGVTHGPTSEKNYSQKISKAIKTKALYVLLSQKFKAGEIIFVESLPETGKTKDSHAHVVSLVKGIHGENLALRRKPRAHIALGEPKTQTQKSLQNLPYVTFDSIKQLSPLDLVNRKYLIVTHPEASVEFLASKTAK
jgi:large subunit ribosomal protein L4